MKIEYSRSDRGPIKVYTAAPRLDDGSYTTIMVTITVGRDGNTDIRIKGGSAMDTQEPQFTLALERRDDHRKFTGVREAKKWVADNLPRFREMGVI